MASVVQSASVLTTWGSSGSADFPAAVTAGNAILAFFGSRSDGHGAVSVSTVPDGAATEDLNRLYAGGGRGYQFSLFDSVGGFTTVSFTAASGQTYDFIIVEVEGINQLDVIGAPITTPVGTAHQFAVDPSAPGGLGIALLWDTVNNNASITGAAGSVAIPGGASARINVLYKDDIADPDTLDGISGSSIQLEAVPTSYLGGSGNQVLFDLTIEDAVAQRVKFGPNSQLRAEFATGGFGAGFGGGFN